MKVSYYFYNSMMYFLIITAVLVLVGVIKINPHYSPRENSVTKQDNLAIQIENTQDSVRLIPNRLIIPKINVDARVEFVGIEPDGLMGVPKDPDNVGWFSPGVAPGEKGAAVIAGHRGWRNKRPVVFDKLSQLSEGDNVYTIDTDGVLRRFTVKKTKTYDPTSDTSELFTAPSEYMNLNLVTCSGNWDSNLKTSSERLVVFTEYDPYE